MVLYHTSAHIWKPGEKYELFQGLVITDLTDIYLYLFLNVLHHYGHIHTYEASNVNMSLTQLYNTTSWLTFS